MDTLCRFCRRLALGALLAGLALAGCGGGNGSRRADRDVAPGGILTIRHPSARQPGDLVAALRVTAFSNGGARVFGPRIEPFQSRIVVAGVPLEAATATLEYLDASGAQRGSFATGVDLADDGLADISDPAFVDDPSVDPVVQSFVFFGCNRVAKSDIDSHNPSSANTAQIQADFQEIPALDPVPGHLFVCGDLVTNLESGHKTLDDQLKLWLELYRSTPLASSPVTLVPFTGNHEVLEKDSSGNELPNPKTLPVWLDRMGPYLRGSDGPTTAPPNADGLTEDQSQFSYTFQVGATRFVVLNTDTFVDDTTTGDIPLNWVQAQLSAAQADGSVAQVFVLGHRPVESPDPGNPGIRAAEATAFAQALNQPAGPGVPTKVRAYLCAHAHLWDYSVPDLSGSAATVPQIIAGNGGSPVEKSFRSGYYGYTVVQVLRSGSVAMASYGRPLPDPYDDHHSQPAATLREQRSVYVAP